MKIPGGSGSEVPIDISKGEGLLSRYHRFRNVTSGKKGRVIFGDL
jgi:hypothetical protein